MASIIPRPLSRFRKQDPSDRDRRLHERWGDVSISAPTGGSWNQFSTSHHHQPTHHHHHSGSYGPGYVPEHAAPARSNSNSNSNRLSTFNPRRLSMRLAPRSKTPTLAEGDEPSSPTGSCHPLIERRPEFAYRPIHQDYPAEVASTTTHRMSLQPSQRFRYIPAGAQSSSPSERASVRDSVQTVWPGEHAGKAPRCRESVYYGDSDGDDDSAEGSRRSDYRGSADYGYNRRFSVGVSEKKKKRATRTLTMAMVPDSEDIYG